MRIKFVQNQPHCFAYGGFEIQMLSTLQAVQETGVDADKLDPWSRENNFDIIHLWGLELNHSKILHFAKKDGKKVIVTALFDSYSTTYKKLRHFISSRVYKTRILKEMVHKIDKVVVVNELEAVVAHKYFGVPYTKISIIPHLVDDIFYAHSNTKASFHGLTDYVLCTGNICPRKNQLRLVQACKKAGLKLVLMGNVLTGEEKYATLVEAEMDEKNMLWLRGVKENSNELLDAYLNCAVFALPSFSENSPIGALEALATGCKVILADRNYSYQSFFRNVDRVDPTSVDDIAKELLNVLAVNEPHRSNSLIDECRSSSVGLKYKELYNNLVN